MTSKQKPMMVYVQDDEIDLPGVQPGSWTPPTEDELTKQARKKFTARRKGRLQMIVTPKYSSHLSLEEKEFFESELYPALDQAYDCLIMMNGEFRKAKEKYFKEFYEHYKKYEKEYFRVFESVETHVLAFQCTCVLGTYSTLLRHHKDLNACQRVMKIYARALKRHGELVVELNEKKLYNYKLEKDKHEELKAKYMMIKQNLIMDLGDMKSRSDMELGEMFYSLVWHDLYKNLYSNKNV